MKITEVTIGDIKPYLFNNRTHPTEQVALIARSIKEFGFNQPLVIDGDNEILVGHGRWLAAKELNLKTVPCYVVEKLTETQRKAYRILDNKLQNDSAWDFDALSSEILKLDEDNFPCEEWGLDKLLLGIEEEDPEPVEDEAPEPPKETFIKLGDVVELGAHRLMCGDSTSAEDVATLLQERQVEALISDPPYGVDYVGKTKDALTIAGDDSAEVAIDGIKNAAKGLKDGGAIYICFPAEELKALSEIWTDPLRLQSMLIWVKQSIVMGRKDYQYRHEPIWYGWKEGSAHRFNGDRTNPTVIEFDRPSRSSDHPTMKPIELFALLIKNSTRKEDEIIDPFLGSGTTLIASEQLGRVCYGMELEPKYCHVIVKRYAIERERTGKPIDIKINGEPFPKEWIDY
jgi:DNA modification methylase